MGSVIHLEIPPRRDHLALVRGVITSAASIGHRLNQRRLEDLRLAVSEACANAIDGQERTGDTRPLEVHVEVEDHSIAVTITDHAGGFVPDDLAALPSATDPGRLRHERGLGIPLMRSLADDVRFTAADGGTAVRLELKF
ncbi:MAG: ATP-binding protein [Actinomycetota bacterium]|nr:ATP-binding protein [Actinomycetota bacterium]